jgi:hypothetical protein
MPPGQQNFQWSDIIKNLKINLIFILWLFVLLGFGGNGYANLTEGLVAYYPFNGNANDLSGNGNHGTIYGAVFVQGKFGQGLEFADSNNTYVEVPHSSSLTPSNAITISLWVKVYSYSTPFSCLVYKAGELPTTSFTDRCYTLWATSWAGLAGVCIASTPEGASSQIYMITSGSLYNLNEFVHFAGIVDTASHTMKIYINGNLVQTCPYNGNSIRGGTYPLRIGAPFKTAGDQSGFNGVIDEVRLYNRALSDTEIQQLAKPNISSIVCLLLMD